ncbi:MAG: hypothetical protein ACKO7N_05830 [Candidatus Nitrosotenuis sp.]
MKKKNMIILGTIMSSVGIVFGLIFSAPSEKIGGEQIYHIMLANPNLYQNGIFVDTFFAKHGKYQFRFVPSGESPEKLSIKLKGKSFSFDEDYVLESTEHGDFGKYYTWKYLGQASIEIPEDQNLEITINPNGNLVGSVSVYLINEIGVTPSAEP